MLLNELARALKVKLYGDALAEVSKLSSLDKAQPGDVTFVTGSRFKEQLASSKATAVIVPESMQDIAPGNVLVSKNPYASYAQASWLLKPEAVHLPGIHPTAIVHSSTQVAESAYIGPNVIIGANCLVGAGSIIKAGVVLGDNVTIGENVHCFPNVTIYDQVTMGDFCRIQSGAVLGSEGFGFAWADGQWMPIQQTGGLLIGNHVHIGANTTIDCGAINPTIIADGVILDNQIQIAHNVQIGEHTAVAGCVGIAGSTTIGSYCQIGGACNIVGHLSIADRVVINAASLVTQSIAQAGRYGSGMPLLPENAWRRSFVSLSKLEGLFKRVKHLERQTKLNE